MGTSIEMTSRSKEVHLSSTIHHRKVQLDVLTKILKGILSRPLMSKRVKSFRLLQIKDQVNTSYQNDRNLNK